ncbi:MAG: transposase [Treponema sp.]|nr:transposase [Treponema sp.]
MRAKRGVEALEGRAGPERVHARLSAPPKRGAAGAAGRMKGKSAIRIYREMIQWKGRANRDFWARGYYASTAGLD